MKNIITIIKKETLDTLRDKRTLMVMVLVPLLVFPLIFTITNNIQSSVMEREQEKTIKIGFVSEPASTRLQSFLEGQSGMELVFMDNKEELRDLIRNDSLQYGLFIPSGFEQNLLDQQQANISLYFSGASITGKDRIENLLEQYKTEVVQERLQTADLPQSFLEPFETETINVATGQEMFGKLAGGFLPYLFIIFCFTGAMYPAIDLFTGEKERKTLETLLTTPVSRIEILTGKMTVIAVTGLVSAMLAIVGLFIGLQISAGLPDFIMSVAMSILSVGFVVYLLVMLIPLTIFFAGLMIPLTIYAKSFKEAQSILTPLTFLIIIPAAIGLIPGIEYTFVTALIPVVNITLATKEIIAGTIHLPHYLVTVVSLIGLAAASVVFCANWFGKESNILR